MEQSETHILIRDIGPWDEFLTVTNAAEQVVEELAARVGERLLEYIDSEGDRGVLLIQNGKFAGFARAWKEQS